MKKKLIKKVKLYLDRAKDTESFLVHNPIPSYPLEEEGYWSIMSGVNGYYQRHEPMAMVQGRFVDAVAYAVQQPKFYGYMLEQHGNPGHRCNGYIVKLEPKKLEAVDGLEELVES
jgi:predicted NUDIX family NTP pyrophosphohydrolase